MTNRNWLRWIRATLGFRAARGVPAGLSAVLPQKEASRRHDEAEVERGQRISPGPGKMLARAEIGFEKARGPAAHDTGQNARAQGKVLSVQFELKVSSSWR